MSQKSSTVGVFNNSFASQYSVGDRLWIPHEKEAFVNGRVETVSMTKMEVKLEGELNNTVYQVKAKEAIPVFDPCGSHLNDNYDNLVDLDELTEAAILYHVRKRFKRKLIYTFVGSILVAVNPFERLPIYEKVDIDRSSKVTPGASPEPHVFSTAATAYRQLTENCKNQSVLISGESGAGKTETTKKVLTYLAKVAPGLTNTSPISPVPPPRRSSIRSSSASAPAMDVSIEDKILMSNPLLEALGNAKTLRNNNSSRFGKFMRVDFDNSFRINGGEIVNYLLEKSRVVVQNDKERNYHVFYQLIRGATPDLRSKLKLFSDANAYNILNQSGCDSIEGVDDRAEFEAVLDSMTTLQFPTSFSIELFQILSAVLLIGNVDFVETSADSCVISPQSSKTIEDLSALLGIDNHQVSYSLTGKTVTIGKTGGVVGIKYNLHQALDVRDSLAKSLYSSLFDMVIAKVNTTLKSADTANSSKGYYIGILDIFGFEIFQVNSFEQMCINYANEKLQHHFNDVIFTEERRMYESEGIDLAEIRFEDNSECVKLVEGKPFGLLAILDEECVLGNASDATYINKLDKHFSVGKSQTPNKNFIKHKTNPNIFSVMHFAGKVDYYIEGFLDKNRDSMSQSVLETLAASKFATVKSMFADKLEKTQESSPDKEKAAGKVPKYTLGGQFRSQLINLISTLKHTEPHFIRCVKPNDQKVAAILDGHLTLRQLKYAGLFEAIRIRKSGFSYRMNINQFAKMYRVLAKNTIVVLPGAQRASSASIRDERSPIELCQSILTEMSLKKTGLNIEDYFVGKTKVFMKETKHRNVLERLKSDKVKKYVVILQTFVRMFLSRLKLFHLKYEHMQANQSLLMQKQLVFRAARTIQKWFRGFFIRKSLDMMHDLLELRKSIAMRDTSGIRILLARIDFSARFDEDYMETNGLFKSVVKTPMNPTVKKAKEHRSFLQTLMAREVTLGKAIIKVFSMQSLYLDQLKQACLRHDLVTMNELVVKCERVDLASHEVVIKAKAELQKMFSKKEIIQKLLFFLKQNDFSTKVSSAPSSQYFDINELVHNMDSVLEEASRYDIDPMFVSKIRVIYESLKPRILLRQRIRKALELLDINEVINCVLYVAKMSKFEAEEVFLSPKKRKAKGAIVVDLDEIQTLSGKDFKEDSRNLRRVMNILSKMIAALTDLPDEDDRLDDDLDGNSPASRSRAIAMKMVYVEAELRSASALFTLIELERSLESGFNNTRTSSFENVLVDDLDSSFDDSGMAKAGWYDEGKEPAGERYDGPRLSAEVKLLCDVTSQCSDEKKRRKLLNKLFQYTKYDVYRYEQIIRHYKWSRTLSFSWCFEKQIDGNDRSDINIQGGVFEGLDVSEAATNPFILRLLHNNFDPFLGTTSSASLGVHKPGVTTSKPPKDMLQELNKRTLSEIPSSIVNTMRSLSQLTSLERESSAKKASNNGAKSTMLDLFGDSDASSDTTPVKRVNYLSPPRKPALDTNVAMTPSPMSLNRRDILGSSSRTPLTPSNLSNNRSAGLSRSINKSMQKLKSEKFHYDPDSAKKENDDPSLEQALLASRGSLKEVKKSMQTTFAKLDSYNQTTKFAWKPPSNMSTSQNKEAK